MKSACKILRNGRNKMNVIFDMDGLMFDTEKVFIKAWDYAGEKIGIGKAGYMVYKTLGMSVVASYEIWKEEFGDRYNQEELRKYTKEFLKNYYENNKVPVKQGLYVLLEYLKNENAKLAVASSSPRWEVEKHLTDAGIIGCFSAIVCGDMVEKSKPAPDIYLKACEMLSENPEECFALEDSKNGLLSAYRAGCKPIIVPDLWQPDEEILQIVKGKYSDLEQVKKAFESGELQKQGDIVKKEPFDINKVYASLEAYQSDRLGGKKTNSDWRQNYNQRNK